LGIASVTSANLATVNAHMVTLSMSAKDTQLEIYQSIKSVVI